ncbi:adenine phosphoribosyltransferase [Croceicoccus estronivorus]|uniref:adenine phosphoribosyltransferase n=1 Tax=Croceicoccus estronivorus TaxID=1172626 RepID=UPI00082B2DD4|nr:adenine phosphoribosyltransferase [Croceicoccus estronivorus]OCC24063.1 adenine phosphoribosyltransferase [Croceicoccus estronivorus]
MTPDELKALIRTVPDFPRPGIQFRDITSLIAHAEGLHSAIEMLALRAREVNVDAIAGMEARGFIFGAAVAARLGVGFLPVRKRGKLPVPTIGIDYALEYGTDRLEIDPSLVQPGANILLLDDLLATGGTALAAARLLRQAGARVDYALFVIDLPDLGGAAKLGAESIAVDTLVQFEGD